MPVSLPLILGSDASGTIVEVGSKVHNFQIGDDVVIQPGTLGENWPSASTCSFSHNSRF